MYDKALPLTSDYLAQSPYPPLPSPAENVAERLVILGHMTFNPDIWATSPERLKRYWDAYLEHVEACANTNNLAIWWQDVTAEMGARHLGNDLLHEKNLLVAPHLLDPPASASDVLTVFRRQAPYLIDRARIWNKTRKNTHG